MDVTHLGHSCLLVEASGVRVLVDPGTWSPGFHELAGLDAVLVTHAHPDHLDVELLPLLLEANDGVRVVTEPEVAAQLGGVGIEATALHPGETFELAGLAVRAVGGEHALIHTDIPRIGNVGFVIAEDGGPTLFHPGDALDATPEGVDVLALPLSAPWAAARETADFARAVAPGAWFPIHDALLSETGRALYRRVVGGLLPERVEAVDLAGRGAVTF